MKRLCLVLAGTILAALTTLHASAAHAASFNYHGSLQDSGKPAEGSYDLELTLFTTASGGRAVGGPLLLYKVPRTRRAGFSVAADFGPLSNVNPVPRGWK